MVTTSEGESQPTASEPAVTRKDLDLDGGSECDLADSSSSASSRSDSDSSDRKGRPSRPQRPKMKTRKSSGTIIVSRDDPNIEMEPENYDADDARAMSPRRSSEELDMLEKGARQALIEQAKLLQASLLNIVDRVQSVKNEHEKLEGGNKFLQSYIGELMQTSKITSTSSSRGKGKARATR